MPSPITTSSSYLTTREHAGIPRRRSHPNPPPPITASSPLFVYDVESAAVTPQSRTTFVTSTTTNGVTTNHRHVGMITTGRYVRRIMTRFLPTIPHSTTTTNSTTTTSSDKSAAENDKYQRHHRRYQHALTSSLVLMIGLVLVATCSLLLVWNMYFNLYQALGFDHYDIRNSNFTKNLHQPQPRVILPDESHLTGLRTNALTLSNTTVAETEWKNDENVVHVIQTRFMQNQPHLVTLGQARLRLFTAVTVPSMRHQTQQQFLWIIRTDPRLHSSILLPLMETISLLPNAILVASNHNPEGFRDSSCISDITTQTLLVGNMEYVQSYYRAGQTHTVLETRCDADDAIAIDFVELIQKSATSGLYPLREDWIVYCADHHMEWQYDNPWPNDVAAELPSNYSTGSTDHDKAEDPSDSTFDHRTTDRGALLVLKSGRCVTPGLTWGYSINASRRDIPVSQHQKIQKAIKPCGTRITHDAPPLQTKCLIKLGDDLPLALRARTPTSAGMDHVFVAHQTEDAFPMEHLQLSKARTMQNQLWSVLVILFGVHGDDLYQVRQYVSDHFVLIARDALAGQCTPGHSCKQSSKALLQKLIDAADHQENIAVNETLANSLMK